MHTKRILTTIILLFLAGLLIFQIPAVKERALWGYIQAEAYLRGVIRPAGQIPTPLPTPTPPLNPVPLLKPSP